MDIGKTFRGVGRGLFIHMFIYMFKIELGNPVTDVTNPSHKDDEILFGDEDASIPARANAAKYTIRSHCLLACTADKVTFCYCPDRSRMPSFSPKLCIGFHIHRRPYTFLILRSDPLRWDILVFCIFGRTREILSDEFLVCGKRTGNITVAPFCSER